MKQRVIVAVLVSLVLGILGIVGIQPVRGHEPPPAAAQLTSPLDQPIDVEGFYVELVRERLIRGDPAYYVGGAAPWEHTHAIEAATQDSRAWAVLVGFGLIHGNPSYYANGLAAEWEKQHARVSAVESLTSKWVPNPTWGPVERWRPMVARHFGPMGRTDQAMRVMRCESRGNPYAENRHSSASGLFQFLDSTWRNESARSGRAPGNVYDGETNIRLAAEVVWRDGSWRQWSCRP